MRESLKREINEQLSRLAEGIQVHSSSVLAWGEPDLPECFRNELEEVKEYPNLSKKK